MVCPVSGYRQPACHLPLSFLGSGEVMPQQFNFISAPQSDVADGWPWEPADVNRVSWSTACVEGSSCWRVWCKERSLNQVKAIGDEVPISSQLHTLPPPAPALPQTQSDKKKKKTTVDQISYSIPPAQLSLGGNSYLITALSPYGKWSISVR